MNPGSTSGASGLLGLSRTAVPWFWATPEGVIHFHGALWREARPHVEAT